MAFTIFGIAIIDWLTAGLLMLAAGYLVLFIGFLFGKERPDYGKYFRMMFAGYETSTLRIGFRVLILGIEYILGIIVITFIQLAYYPAFIIRLLVKMTLISNQRVQDKDNEIKEQKLKRELRD
jgi:hypothetical protein